LTISGFSAILYLSVGETGARRRKRVVVIRNMQQLIGHLKPT